MPAKSFALLAPSPSNAQLISDQAARVQSGHAGRGHHTNSSVRYFAESALARWIRSACSVWLSFGGGAVRLSTGSPTAMNNSSCPAGVHMQTRRAGLSDLFLNEWGALAGVFQGSPACDPFGSPRNGQSVSPSQLAGIS